LRWALVAISASILAGICLRFRATRNLRILFLLGSLVVLGFYNGACPCPILSVMHTVRMAMGKMVRWQNLVYFVGLIPVTYIFGRVWCGWVCHMGALQEFIFLPSRFDMLRSRKAQKVFRVTRYLLLAGLIFWVASTGAPRWCRYDPFKTAYTLFSATRTGWVLLGLVLVSSLFVYRPFCRIACPIGLMLGWVSRIPGASVVGLAAACPVCLSCARACRIDAITQEKRSYTVDNEDCNGCGECMDACRIGGMALYRKSGSHPTTYKVDTSGGDACPEDQTS
ncbi:MAG TPA: 4Fe-4S binding protein, partial [Candidatus Krumholzibacterium sp.]|nr:4Fe-4S binding protein [Candidatus Krumholzibacterium sp.]